MKLDLVRVLPIAAILLGASPAAAICPDSDCSTTAKTILVRQSCAGLQNCFESVSKLSGKSNAFCLSNVQTAGLQYGGFVGGMACQTSGWLWGARHPSASDRVVVDVGPGTFESFVCPVGQGHFVVRGAGRDQTKFRGEPLVGSVGMDVYGCDEVVVSELTAEGGSYGVRWLGAGEGAWSRVDMIGNRGLVPPPAGSGLTAGWVDECYGALGFGTAESKQIVSDSRAIATGPGGQGYGYTSDCAETYFFGGQIASTMTATGIHAGLAVGGFDFGRAVPPRFFSFGTQILSQPVGMNAQNSTVQGADSQNGALIHLQDGSVRATAIPTAPGTANSIGLRTVYGGVIERFGTPVDATTTAGTATEVSNE